MVKVPRVIQALAFVGMVAAATSATTAEITAAATTTDTTDTTASTATSGTSTSDSSATTTAASTDSTDSSATTTTTDASSAGTSGGSSSTFGLTNVPTIDGASIPTLVIPYTANAPFMQKSTLPQGTFFIAVGAVLAFLGACVLLWRVLVAWSVNRSVRKAALASMRGSEKSSKWGGSGHGGPKGNLYKDFGGSSMSLDALTSSGKPANKPHFRDHETKRDSTPPAGLFFSPTAQAGSGAHNANNRTSTYLPAGYYASPSAQAAGGAGSTTIGGSLAPYARNGIASSSPPASPGLAPTNRHSYRASSRDGLRGGSRDGLRAPASRDSYGNSRPNSYLDSGRQGRASGMYAQPSSSSLMVGMGGNHSNEGLAGSRAPSAYLEELFDNHGNGPRERF